MSDELMNNQQGQEFQILGISMKWRGPLIIGIVTLSVMLNVYLVMKVMSIQDKLYERVITEIKEPMNKINQNIEETNKKLEGDE